jgi:hemin uptake protein HemP
MSLASSPSQTVKIRIEPVVSVSNHSGGCSSGDEHAVRQTSTGVNSTDLLRGQKAIQINHNGSTYRLQATRLGKLILTK